MQVLEVALRAGHKILDWQILTLDELGSFDRKEAI